MFSCFRVVCMCVWLSVELGGSDGRQTAAQAARPEVITMYYLFLGVSWIDAHKHTYITISFAHHWSCAASCNKQFWVLCVHRRVRVHERQAHWSDKEIADQLREKVFFATHAPSFFFFCKIVVPVFVLLCLFLFNMYSNTNVHPQCVHE